VTHKEWWEQYGKHSLARPIPEVTADAWKAAFQEGVRFALRRVMTNLERSIEENDRGNVNEE
jgi:hypothetical protein